MVIKLKTEDLLALYNEFLNEIKEGYSGKTEISISQQNNGKLDLIISRGGKVIKFRNYNGFFDKLCKKLRLL